jgi:Spherulation-specific family 4
MGPIIERVPPLSTINSSIRNHPSLSFTVVINPNSGPDGRPILPDAQYQKAIPYLHRYPNVTLVGYILTRYGKRAMEHAISDINTYNKWAELVPEMGLDGIFIDEVDCDGSEIEYFRGLHKHIKGLKWRRRQPGALKSRLH